MKKNAKWIIVAVLAVIVCVYCISTYNSLARQEQEVDTAWANVEAQYQRRAGLIPNLVATVQGYAKHEQETFTQVVDARAKALGTSGNIEEYVEAQQQVTAALGRLIAISENYPELKADANFLELQAQLEGTENRITVARNEYNEQVKKFNTATVTFPSNLIAGMFGFEKKSLFTASEGAAQAPQVKF